MSWKRKVEIILSSDVVILFMRDITDIFLGGIPLLEDKQKKAIYE